MRLLDSGHNLLLSVTYERLAILPNGFFGSGICVISRSAFGIWKQSGGEQGMRDTENLGRDGKVEKLYWEQLGTLISSKVESVSLFLFFFASNLMVSLSY